MPPMPIRDSRSGFDAQTALDIGTRTVPCQIQMWFVKFWRVEVNFHEIRTHLRVEIHAVVGYRHQAHDAHLIGIIFVGDLLGQ